MTELQKLVADIKSVCMDRMDAITADGLVLKAAFKELETLINDELNKKGKK